MSVLIESLTHPFDSHYSGSCSTNRCAASIQNIDKTNFVFETKWKYQFWFRFAYVGAINNK